MEYGITLKDDKLYYQVPISLFILFKRTFKKTLMEYGITLKDDNPHNSQYGMLKRNNDSMQ